MISEPTFCALFMSLCARVPSLNPVSLVEFEGMSIDEWSYTNHILIRCGHCVCVCVCVCVQIICK